MLPIISIIFQLKREETLVNCISNISLSLDRSVATACRVADTATCCHYSSTLFANLEAYWLYHQKKVTFNRSQPSWLNLGELHLFRGQK